MQSFLQYRRFGKQLEAQLERNAEKLAEQRRQRRQGRQQANNASGESPPLDSEAVDEKEQQEQQQQQQDDAVSSRSSSSLEEDLERADVPDGVGGADLDTMTTHETTGTTLGLALTGIEVRERTTNEGGPALGKVFVVSYEGDRDKMNPHNWGFARRAAATFVLSLIGGVVGWASAIDSAAIPQISAAFGVSDVAASLSTGSFDLDIFDRLWNRSLDKRSFLRDGGPESHLHRNSGFLHAVPHGCRFVAQLWHAARLSLHLRHVRRDPARLRRGLAVRSLDAGGACLRLPHVRLRVLSGPSPRARRWLVDRPNWRPQLALGRVGVSHLFGGGVDHRRALPAGNVRPDPAQVEGRTSPAADGRRAISRGDRDPQGASDLAAGTVALPAVYHDGARADHHARRAVSDRHLHRPVHFPDGVHLHLHRHVPPVAGDDGGLLPGHRSGHHVERSPDPVQHASATAGHCARAGPGPLACGARVAAVLGDVRGAVDPHLVVLDGVDSAAVDLAVVAAAGLRAVRVRDHLRVHELLSVRHRQLRDLRGQRARQRHADPVRGVGGDDRGLDPVLQEHGRGVHADHNGIAQRAARADSVCVL
ncbi:MFS1mrp [Rasamsonia emersonii CBS 393.64]|uniref:MFS1mrp n=1 Tax=Rasamsonia emersonii (strain ATCC 16479 / CBS 393.64 / IMI 116815) TaxID=1408163 RepID=A0A0F4Z4D9_RASE3|nr:MFS1mrp [Rasamsonia emersonii CBS 393.64]KKA24733.1 MFS1mrp [Rasamsonia emersonii CBS 393.64]